MLTGTGINAVTGKFFRHLWSADPANGLCRLDPDIDSPGPHTINAATCLTTVAGSIVLSAGELSFDPNTNDLYAVDQAGKNGIFRLHYLPSGDSGHGLIDRVHSEILGAGCNLAGNQPTAATLGPDGNLYAPPPPAPPGTPTKVTATAGDTVATVSWTPAADGQPVTSYLPDRDPARRTDHDGGDQLRSDHHRHDADHRFGNLHRNRYQHRQ